MWWQEGSMAGGVAEIVGETPGEVLQVHVLLHVAPAMYNRGKRAVR